MQELDICKTPLFLRIHGSDSDGAFEEVEVFEVRLSIAFDMSEQERSVRSSRQSSICQH